MFTYDAIGSYERVGYAAQGQGQALIIPLLDNLVRAVAQWPTPPPPPALPLRARCVGTQVGRRNRHDPAVELSADDAVEMVKEAFVTAGEVRAAACLDVLLSHGPGLAA